MLTIFSLILFVLGILLLRETKSRLAGRLLAATASFIFVCYTAAYYASDAITGKGIDEAAFFYALYGLEGAGFGAYKSVIAASILLILFGLFLAYLVFRTSKAVGRPQGSLFWRMLGFAALAFSFVVHPASTDLVNLTTAHPYYSQAGMSNYYRTPRFRTKTLRQPNIVFIYAESLERTYFDEARFPGLIVGLKDLEKNALTFTDVQQTTGVGWTIGGITASQCGIPLMTTGGGGNSMGSMDKFLPGAVCMGDLMRGEGYNLSYMGGAELRFGGKGKFFSTHGFDEVRGREELAPQLSDPEYQSEWGLYDDALFDMAFERFEELAAAGDKFGLFLLTLDTHHPSGHVNRTCEGTPYGDGSNPMLNAVACSDRIITDFVTRILDSEYAEDTVIVIASDHLAIQNDAFELLNQKGEKNRRNLFMVLGPGRIQPGQIAKPATAMDIGPTVLGQLGLDVPALGLGRSLVDPDPTLVEKFKTADAFGRNIVGWKDDLVRFWSMPNVGKEIEVDPERRTVRLGDQTVQLPLLLEFGDNLATKKLTFPEYFNPVLCGWASKLKIGEPFMWIDQCRNVRVLDGALPTDGICLYSGRMGKPEALSMVVDQTTRVSAAELKKSTVGAASPDHYQHLMARFWMGATEVQDQDLAFLGEASEGILLKSYGYPGASPDVVTEDSKFTLLYLGAGVNLLGFGKETCLDKLANVNPFRIAAQGQPKKIQEPFAKIMEQHSEDYEAFAIVVYESAFLQPTDLSPLFEGLPLEKWKTLQFRQPYIAYLDPKSGIYKEYTGAPESAIALRLRAPHWE